MTDSLADAAPALHRGEPKIHGPEAFEGMRKAGQLAAAALDELEPDEDTGHCATSGREDVAADGG